MNLEKIMKLVDDFGSDNISVFGGEFEGGIHLQQVKDEISPCVLELLKYKDSIKNFMEIGSAAGGNTYFFNHFFNFENITIVDDNNHQKHKLRDEILSELKYNEIIGDSHSIKTLKRVENLNIIYDIIFIDGDHSYKGVKQDTEMYIHLLKNGGFVIYHDSSACPDDVGLYTKQLTTHNEFNLIKIDEYLTKTHTRACGVVLYKKIDN